MNFSEVNSSILHLLPSSLNLYVQPLTLSQILENPMDWRVERKRPLTAPSIQTIMHAGYTVQVVYRRYSISTVTFCVELGVIKI